MERSWFDPATGSLNLTPCRINLDDAVILNVMWHAGTPMELRIATISDADAIIALDHVAASDPARVQFIHDQIKSSACYVAVVDSNVATGYGPLLTTRPWNTSAESVNSTRAT